MPWGAPWEQLTCPGQVKDGMNMGKRCLQSRPRGPAPKIAQPGRAGYQRQPVERRRCGTTLFVCSLGAEPTCPACPGPPWGLPWRDLQFRGPFLEMFFDDRSGERNHRRESRSPVIGLPLGNHNSPTQCTAENAIPIRRFGRSTLLMSRKRYSPFGVSGGVSFLTRKQWTRGTSQTKVRPDRQV